MLNLCDFIQVYDFTTNHHLSSRRKVLAQFPFWVVIWAKEICKYLMSIEQILNNNNFSW